jgi:hypothetical protein
VQQVFQVSPDGSHVYFVARGVLTGSASNSLGETATNGAENLYVFERDAEFPTGRTSFITSLKLEEIQRLPTAVTQDGHFFAFSSFTGVGGVFFYDAQSGELTQVSPSGVIIKGASLGFSAISSDGSYLVFESRTALALGAVEGVNNVYEYHDGVVYLISDGHDATLTEGQPSVRVRGVTASGGDIFFTTADRLVGQDTDTQQDFYDARVDGGFPAPVVPGSCVGEGCQGQSSGVPGFASPASTVSSGAGNVVAVPLVGPVLKPKPKSRALTRAQKLADALKACERQPRKRRAGCDARARGRYGGKPGVKKKSVGGKLGAKAKAKQAGAKPKSVAIKASKGR